MRKRTGGRWPLTALVLAIGGCGDQLYVGSDTVLGIAVGYNSAREAGRIDIGYDRHFVTWIPQSVPQEEGEEAMSVLGCTQVKIGNLNLQKFQESLATGKAAAKFAEALKDDSSYFSCFQPTRKGS